MRSAQYRKQHLKPKGAYIKKDCALSGPLVIFKKMCWI